jgi:hypothetical protein
VEKNRIGSEYLHKLQSLYYHIGNRGICVDKKRLEEASAYISQDITKQCDVISNLWGIKCYIGAANKPERDSGINSINLNSSSGNNTPLVFLKDKLGFKIPKVSGRDEDGNYISKESLAELSLQKIYALNQFNTPGGDPAIRALLRIRELGTLRARYINANLFNQGQQQVFLTNYNVAGTVTGRRGSRKHSFGFGGNAQNFPKHGELARIFRRCLVSRPGFILLSVDQMQAEDWPTSALAGNTEALSDLQNGVDRHRKLACAIFQLPWDHYSEQQWKESIERYLGKKTRHANNYGMRGNTMSDSLAKEGYSLTPAQCDNILTLVNAIDPSVDKVFHKYIKDELDATRTLKTPFGRERIFFGLRPGETGSNTKIFNEAYSYIPQSTVGDNTGFAVYELETGNEQTRGCIIQEGHDSIIQEIPDDVGSIWNFLQATKEAFNRRIYFHNGIHLQIPVEGEIGFDFHHTVSFKNKQSGSKKLEDLNYQDVQIAYYKLKEYQEQERIADAAKETVSKLD